MATINKPYNELLQLDYKLNNLVTQVAELLDRLVGDSKGKVIKRLESGMEQIGIGLKQICTIPCHTNNETML